MLKLTACVSLSGRESGDSSRGLGWNALQVENTFESILSNDLNDIEPGEPR